MKDRMFVNGGWITQIVSAVAGLVLAGMVVALFTIGISWVLAHA